MWPDFKPRALRGIKVSVQLLSCSTYIAAQSSPSDSVYGFACTVTISNTGQVAAQLISRHWEIVDANGHIEEVKGLSVVGHQPLLQPGESFQYSSSSRLRTPTGAMHGRYFCAADDGTRFDAVKPIFVFEASIDPQGGTNSPPPTCRTLP